VPDLYQVIGVKWLLKVERSDLPEKLKADWMLIPDLTMSLAGDRTWGPVVVLEVAPLEEDESGRSVLLYQADVGAGYVQPLWAGAVSGKLRVAAGPSMMFMDFEGRSYDTLGFGLFGHAALGFYSRNGSVGLEANADLHGWVGLDFPDFQSAWSSALGVGLVIRF
jgi:hypothetical protein